MSQTANAAVFDGAEARRKSRQGSETRDMKAQLRVRYDERQLQALSARAGKRLPQLIRQYGDFLTEILPIADEKGIDPLDLIRQTLHEFLDPEDVPIHKQAS